MQAVCPITDKRIDEKVSRLNAMVTVALMLVFFVFYSWGTLLFLAIDFAIRGFVDSKYSPVCQMNKWIARTFSFDSKPINAGPKIFAAQVGFFLSVLTLLALLFSFKEFGLVIAAMLGFFSFLEFAFGICVACKLYPLIRRK